MGMGVVGVLGVRRGLFWLGAWAWDALSVGGPGVDGRGVWRC